VDNSKIELIKLINEFCEVGKQAILLEDDTSEDRKLNDELNSIALKIEEASISIFGYKVEMNFGTMNAVFHDTEEVIREIKDFKKSSKE